MTPAGPRLAPVDARTGPLAVLLTSVAAIVLGAAFAFLASGGSPGLALLAPLMLVPVLIWRQPVLGLYLLFAAVVSVEQFEYTVGPRSGAATAGIPVFQGVLPAGVNPAEILLLLTGTVVVMKSVQRRRPWVERSPLLVAIAVVGVLVVLFFALGLARGGDVKMALWEVRPYIYLILTFLLAAHLVRDFAAVRPLLWILVVGTGIKAITGLTIFWSVRHMDPRPEAVLAHEESFFFGTFIICTAAMWVFRYRTSIRAVATILLPIVLVADLVNSRRTAWLILFSGLAVLALVALVRLKEHRRSTAWLLVICVICGSAYLGAFWGQNGTVAQPARAVRSVIAPDDRDRDSNLYREVEDFNLRMFISQTHGLGAGYGQRMAYVGLVDLTKDNPILGFVPHNNVLWVWLRMGILGMVAVAVMLTQAMVNAARLSADKRREVAMLGAIVAAALTGYVAMGAKDLGFFWFRNALAMGLLLGVVEGLLRAERALAARGGPASSPTEATSGRDASPLVGSRA